VSDLLFDFSEIVAQVSLPNSPPNFEQEPIIPVIICRDGEIPNNWFYTLPETVDPENDQVTVELQVDQINNAVYLNQEDH
jgi:hypothetical protein